MASLATNFVSFLFIFPVGIRRMLCSFSLYLKGPSQYRSRTWYFSDPKWKNFDFYTLLIALPLASFSNVFFFLAFSGHPTFKFSFLQQSLVIFLFWLLLILIVCKESLDLFTIDESFVFVFGGIAFGVEFLMNGKGVVGLGGDVYEILGGLSLVCAGCCLYLSIWPTAFFAEFLLSSGIVLKGTWVLQVGFSLYTDVFALKGCKKVSNVLGKGETDVKCELEEDKLRGIALMHLVFIGHAMLVIIISFLLFGVLYRNRSMRFGEASGPLLAEIGSENVQVQALPEFD